VAHEVQIADVLALGFVDLAHHVRALAQQLGARRERRVALAGRRLAAAGAAGAAAHAREIVVAEARPAVAVDEADGGGALRRADLRTGAAGGRVDAAARRRRRRRRVAVAQALRRPVGRMVNAVVVELVLVERRRRDGGRVARAVAKRAHIGQIAGGDLLVVLRADQIVDRHGDRRAEHLAVADRNQTALVVLLDNLEPALIAHHIKRHVANLADPHRHLVGVLGGEVVQHAHLKQRTDARRRNHMRVVGHGGARRRLRRAARRQRNADAPCWRRRPAAPAPVAACSAHRCAPRSSHRAPSRDDRPTRRAVWRRAPAARAVSRRRRLPTAAVGRDALWAATTERSETRRHRLLLRRRRG
jgi:hypothetical protein